jgi:hypothetical protein
MLSKHSSAHDSEVGVLAEPIRTAEVFLRYLINHPGWYTSEQLLNLTGCPAWAAGPALVELRERRWVMMRGSGRTAEYRLKPIDLVTRPKGWAFGPGG